MRPYGIKLRIPLRGPWALAVGAVCLGLAVYQGLVSSTLATHGERAEAVVVDVDSRLRRHGWSGRSYRLTLEFEDRQGSEQRAATGYDTSYGGHRVGDRLEVLYNPNDPSEFAIDSWYDLWAWPLMLVALGTLACGAFLRAPSRRGA